MTVTVVVLVGLGFLATGLLRPFAPVPPPNTEALKHGDYLSKNAYGLVSWKVWGPEATEEAKERRKPILLTIGRWGSPAALYLDRMVFSDPEVAEQVNRSFVPVRIDLEENPEWQGIFLPLQKTSRLPEPGFELLALNPEYGLAAWTTDKLDLSGVVKLLTQARRDSDKAALPRQDLQENETSQFSDLRYALPDRSHLDELSRWLKADSGMLKVGGRVTLRPWLWRCLAAGGLVQEAADSFLAWTASPMMDGAGVSFFYTGDKASKLTPEPIKLLEPNLDAMVFAARSARMLGRSELAYLAVRMADGIDKEFLGQRLPASTLVGEAAGQPGTNRFSYKPSVLWAKFSSSEQKALRGAFKLDLLTSGLTVPETKDLQTLLAPSEEVESIRQKLLAIRMQNPPERSSACSTICASQTASRFMEAGALLDRPDLEELGDRMLSLAESAWKKGSVKPIINRSSQAHSLSAALALCEAYLMKWNLTGDKEAKAKGLQLMSEIRARHEVGQRRGISHYPSQLPLPKGGPWLINTFDGASRSDGALLVELLASWAAVSQDPELKELAEETRDQWRGQALLASPAWMGLCEAVIRTEKPPVTAGTRQAWLNEVSRGFDRIVVRREAPTPAATGAETSPSPSE